MRLLPTLIDRGGATSSRGKGTPTRRSLAAFNWSAGLRSVYDTLCGGTTFVFVGFALSLGIAPERIGLITLITSLACLVQIAGIMLLNVIADKKAFVLRVALAEPVILVGTVLLLPFLPSWLRVIALLAAVLAAASSLHLTRPVMDNWVSCTIPPMVRGRYLGRRFQLLSGVTIVCTLAAGFLAERIDKNDSFGMGCLLAVGGVFGFFAVFALRHATMPVLSAEARASWSDVRKILHHAPFRRYLYAFASFNVPFLFACPYYQVFHLTVVHMRQSLIATSVIGYLITKMLLTPLLGRLHDRLGARRLILWSGVIYAIFFAMYPLAGTDRAWLIILAWTFVGAGDAIWAVAGTAALYDAIPETPARPAYFAFASLLSSGLSAAGVLLAMPLLSFMADWSWQLGPFHLSQFHCFYALCAALMVPCLFGAGFLPRRRKADSGT